MVGYWLAGLWTASVTKYYLVSLPVVVVAVFIGRVLNRRLQPRRFVACVDLGLLAIGALLLVQSVWATLRS